MPRVLVVEGTAQATVWLFQLEVSPLRPGETPLLGSVAFRFERSPGWDERLEYRITPVRLQDDRGLFAAEARGGRGLVAAGTLGVARVRADDARGGDRHRGLAG